MTSPPCAIGSASTESSRASPGKAAESNNKLGKHRWLIERSIAWLTGNRRLTIRYERKPSHYLAFLTLAATITCHKKLAKSRFLNVILFRRCPEATSGGRS